MGGHSILQGHKPQLLHREHLVLLNVRLFLAINVRLFLAKTE